MCLSVPACKGVITLFILRSPQITVFGYLRLHTSGWLLESCSRVCALFCEHIHTHTHTSCVHRRRLLPPRFSEAELSRRTAAKQNGSFSIKVREEASKARWPSTAATEHALEQHAHERTQFSERNDRLETKSRLAPRRRTSRPRAPPKNRWKRRKSYNMLAVPN